MKICIALDNILGFADTSSYLTFRLFAWERSSPVSFELLVLKNLSTSFGRTLINVLQRKVKIENFHQPVYFYGLLNFSNIITFKCYNFFWMYSFKNDSKHTIDTYGVMHLRIYACTYVSSFFKKSRFCELHLTFSSPKLGPFRQK